MKLFKHQKEALELVTDNDQFALFMEAGTGKTMVMLYHITNLFMSGEIKNCLIVCPASVRGSWRRDIEKLSGLRRPYTKNITVVSYDLVWRREEYEKDWDCIVLDESHCIASRSSKRTKFLQRLKNRSKYRYILTGTPMHNGHYEDYWSQMEFLIPGYLGTYNEFCAHHTVQRQLPGTYVRIIVKYRNVQELLDKIGQKAYYIDKKSCLDLPEKLPPVVIDCELQEKLKYKQALKSFIQEYDMNIGNPMSIIVKLRQLCSGFVIDDYGDTHELKCEKIKMLDELIDSISGKIVIFAEFTYSLEQIHKLLDKKGISYLTLDGKQSNKSVWREFQSNEDIRIIVCQYRSANAGIDLYAASDMIFYEPTQSSTVVDQAMARIHRNGQTRNCSYYWLLTEKSVEHDIYDRVVNGIDFNVQALENFRRELK